ncbi:hypothetical protein PVK73_17505 [Bacillus thuringiensis]
MNNSWIVNNYLEYIEVNFPNYYNNLSEESLVELKELYYSVNDVFVMCSYFNRDEYQNENYLNLINEFKSYTSRLLLVAPVNDKYLVDSLLRLLIEKLYRILYAHYHTHLLESSIRKHEKRKMSTRLMNKLSKKVELDDLYSEYSELIHHSNPTTTDLLNFRQLSNTDIKLITYISEKVEILKEIFIIDFFTPKVKIINLDLAAKMTLKNQLKNETSTMLEYLNVI